MIPSNLRVPFVAIEFDPSRAFQGASILNYKALIMGQKTTGGSEAELELDRITSKDIAAIDPKTKRVTTESGTNFITVKPRTVRTVTGINAASLVIYFQIVKFQGSNQCCFVVFGFLHG